MVDAALLVRSASGRAQLSARDLAARCGVSASTVTRIERGEINPTVAMLERLLDASGNELIVMVEPHRQPPTIDAVRALRNEIVAAVGRFGGTNVRVSGSVARGTANDESDVDLLIDVPARTGLIAVEQISTRRCRCEGRPATSRRHRAEAIADAGLIVARGRATFDADPLAVRAAKNIVTEIGEATKRCHRPRPTRCRRFRGERSLACVIEPSTATPKSISTSCGTPLELDLSALADHIASHLDRPND